MSLSVIIALLLNRYNHFNRCNHNDLHFMLINFM
nr:MAG TPA: hypothetical protein [Caudoviricetes sp.]